jgi:peptide/nickel transport system substrate-binding protein
MTMSRFSTGVLTAVVAAMMAVAPAQADKKGNSIRFAYDQVVENVDPFMNNVRIGVIIGQQVWDTLIYRDPKTSEYKGQLATAWKWTDDKTLELDLRKGVKFHNGANSPPMMWSTLISWNPDSKVVTRPGVAWIDRAGKSSAYRCIICKRRFRRRSSIWPDPS